MVYRNVGGITLPLKHSPTRTARLNRSELAVPGSNPRFIAKAAASSADVIFFDLEDSVAPQRKEQARHDVIEALNELDFGGKSLSVRINAVDTPYMYRDLVDLVEQAGHKLDLLLIPKVETACQICAVDMLLNQIELAKGIKQPIGIESLIETPLGIQNIFEIAAASPRNESLLFGSADYAAATGAQITMIGGPNADYHVLTDADATGARHASRHGALRVLVRGGSQGAWASPHRRSLCRYRRPGRLAGSGAASQGSGL